MAITAALQLGLLLKLRRIIPRSPTELETRVDATRLIFRSILHYDPLVAMTDADTADIDAQIAKLQEQKWRKVEQAERAERERQRAAEQILVGSTPTKKRPRGESDPASKCDRLARTDTVSRRGRGRDTAPFSTCPTQIYGCIPCTYNKASAPKYPTAAHKIRYVRIPRRSAQKHVDKQRGQA